MANPWDMAAQSAASGYGRALRTAWDWSPQGIGTRLLARPPVIVTDPTTGQQFYLDQATGQMQPVPDERMNRPAPSRPLLEPYWEQQRQSAATLNPADVAARRAARAAAGQAAPVDDVAGYTSAGLPTGWSSAGDTEYPFERSDYRRVVTPQISAGNGGGGGGGGSAREAPVSDYDRYARDVQSVFSPRWQQWAMEYGKQHQNPGSGEWRMPGTWWGQRPAFNYNPVGFGEPWRAEMRHDDIAYGAQSRAQQMVGYDNWKAASPETQSRLTSAALDEAFGRKWAASNPGEYAKNNYIVPDYAWQTNYYRPDVDLGNYL